MKSGRVPGGPVPAQLPFTKLTYNLSQVAGGTQPLLPFLISSLTLKGKSIPLKSFLPLSQGGHCLAFADVFLLVPSYKSCWFWFWFLFFFYCPCQISPGPLSPVLPQPATLGPRLEAQTATALEPCFPPSWLFWEEGFGSGGRVYLVSRLCHFIPVTYWLWDLAFVSLSSP